jgi:hypothetical protein
MYTTFGSRRQSSSIVTLVHSALCRRGESATIFVGYDWNFKEDRKRFASQVDLLNRTYGNGVTISRLFFDESPDDTSLGPSHNISMGGGYESHAGPSYASPFAERHGEWGVFHIVGVPVGHSMDVWPCATQLAEACRGAVGRIWSAWQSRLVVRVCDEMRVCDEIGH